MTSTPTDNALRSLVSINRVRITAPSLKRYSSSPLCGTAWALMICLACALRSACLACALRSAASARSRSIFSARARSASRWTSADVDSALPWRALACSRAAALACDFLARPALSNCSCSALGFAMVDTYRV
ncbi:hypothetical protein D3C72_1171570 [compost metagenome]